MEVVLSSAQIYMLRSILTLLLPLLHFCLIFVESIRLGIVVIRTELVRLWELASPAIVGLIVHDRLVQGRCVLIRPICATRIDYHHACAREPVFFSPVNRVRGW